jgi:hypothetical protein
MVFGLDPFTNITHSHELGYFYPHVVPPETILQIFVHLCAPWVY